MGWVAGKPSSVTYGLPASGQALTHSTSEPDPGTCALRRRAAAGGSYGCFHRAAWCEGRAWPPGSGIPGTKDQFCGLLVVWHLGKFFKL